MHDSLFFFQAEDGIRDLVRSRGLGDVYKRQIHQDVDPGNACEQSRELRNCERLVVQCEMREHHLSLIHI